MSTKPWTIEGKPTRASLIVIERDRRLLILKTNEGLVLPGGINKAAEDDDACLLRTLPQQMPSVRWSEGGFNYWRTFPDEVGSDDSQFIRSYIFDRKQLDIGNLGFYGDDVEDIHSYWYGRQDLVLPKWLTNIVNALHAERMIG